MGNARPVQWPKAKRGFLTQSQCYDTKRIYHHTGANIARATFSNSYDITGIFKRPCYGHNFPVTFLGWPPHPGSRQEENLCTFQYQAAGHSGKRTS